MLNSLGPDLYSHSSQLVGRRVVSFELMSEAGDEEGSVSRKSRWVEEVVDSRRGGIESPVAMEERQHILLGEASHMFGVETLDGLGKGRPRKAANNGRNDPACRSSKRSRRRCRKRSSG